MKIAGAAVLMVSQSAVVEQHTREEALRVWTGRERQNAGGDRTFTGGNIAGEGDTLEISAEAKAWLEKSPPVKGVHDELAVYEIGEKDKQKILVLQKMLEVLTGKKIRFYFLEKLIIKKGAVSLEEKKPGGFPTEAGSAWGMEYTRRETYHESEKMSFVSQGSIKTADGKEFSFAVELTMSREFVSKTEIKFRAGKIPVDPLVINYSGEGFNLLEDRFIFDLDCDGQGERIPFLAPGSGFLAVDWNNDKIINDGGELFGPLTGNGFEELAEHDLDGNGWLDENDPLFHKLRIWVKDPAGNDRLFALGEKGIGAICLGSIDTVFRIKDAGNNLLGQLRKSGIFLKENGTAGMVSHMDFFV